TWLYGGGRALMRRVLASNARVNLFHVGFKACDSYGGGLEAMTKVTAPTLFVLGKGDQMTPIKAAQSLVHAALHGELALVTGGHQMMAESPDAVLLAMRDFLAP
ncbi:MAG: alpha/beta hydrolase, partial [Betaproteobacteria bacterium]